MDITLIVEALWRRSSDYGAQVVWSWGPGPLYGVRAGFWRTNATIDENYVLRLPISPEGIVTSFSVDGDILRAKYQRFDGATTGSLVRQ
jgi:hypothetical protein